MRRILLASLFLVACSSPGRAEGERDREAMEAVLEAQRTAWNAGDLGAYMDGYLHSEDLVFTSGAKIRRGWETARDSYQKRYGNSAEGMGHLEFEIIEVRMVGDDAGVVLGKWFLSDTDNAGEGVFSLVMERTPSGWKVSHDHTSVSPNGSENPEQP